MPNSPQESSREAPGAPLKQCSICGTVWPTLPDFLGDSQVCFVAFQPGPAVQHPGVFLFNHIPCGTTMAIPSAHFLALTSKPLVDMPALPLRRDASFCLAVQEQDECPQACICSFVHATVQLILGWRKADKVL